MPNNGLPVSSIARITGTAYSPVAAGSPGPFDRKKPSGSSAMIASNEAVAGTTDTRAPGEREVTEDVVFAAVVDGDDVGFTDAVILTKVRISCLGGIAGGGRSQLSLG